MHIIIVHYFLLQSAQYAHAGWLTSACSWAAAAAAAAALACGLYSPRPGSGCNESYGKQDWSFNLSPAGPGETHRAAQDWVPARRSDRRQELTRSSAGWGTGWRGGRVEEWGAGVVQANNASHCSQPITPWGQRGEDMLVQPHLLQSPLT